MTVTRRVQANPTNALTPRIPVKAVIIDPWGGSWGTAWAEAWGLQGFGAGISATATLRVSEAPSTGATKRVTAVPGGGATRRVETLSISPNITKRIA